MIKDEVFVNGIGLGGERVGYEFQKKNYPTYLINGSGQDNKTISEAKDVLVLEGYDGLAGDRGLPVVPPPVATSRIIFLSIEIIFCKMALFFLSASTASPRSPANPSYPSKTSTSFASEIVLLSCPEPLIRYVG